MNKFYIHISGTDNPGVDEFWIMSPDKRAICSMPTHEGAIGLMNIIQRAFDRLIKAEVGAWKKRCLLAEEYIEQSPCDPDIYPEQLSAYDAWILKKSKMDSQPIQSEQ